MVINFEPNHTTGTHLIICGGPSCVGKTTLIERIKRNQLPEIRKQLAIYDAENWTFKPSGYYSKQAVDQCPVPEFLFLHFDLYAQTILGPGYLVLEELMLRFHQVTTLELWTNYENYSSRLKRRRQEIAPFTPKGLLQQIRRKKRFLKIHKRLLNQRRFYQTPENIARLHTIWQSFWRPYQGISHYQIECNTPELHLTPRECGVTERLESYRELILELNPDFQEFIDSRRIARLKPAA